MPVVSRLKPPLTLEQLAEIQSRRRDDADVMRLLWEIRRLHTRLIRADQLVDSIDSSGGHAHRLILDAMRDDLAEEPALEYKRIERAKKKKESGAPPETKPRRYDSGR